ncbi:hypothetical protein AVO45_05925 [Ruegeria marisrubri]|uniref:Inositolphosphotransferase Aur1/Ipt1 domain-containing protein n=1 Tax=Ruegeria marisrubri TaxID=1685379 RepID=A0A0X3TXV0_9RHOB|nr:phosphatase PAP2 family protein [Ruegeria marisrubri]KUJ80583.1 hypothetical protein AVO45_05925 [Ruegeria marisrubri]
MTMQIELPAQRSLLGAIFWRNRLFLSIVALYVLAGVGVSLAKNVSFWSGTVPVLLGILDIFKLMLISFATIWIIWRFIYAATSVKPEKPIHWLLADLRGAVLNSMNLVDGTLCFMAVGFMAATFTFFKDLIPSFQPFSWDPQFAELDRFLHGGVDAWTLLWPVFGTPLFTTVLNAAYHAWFILLYVAVFVAAFDRRDPERSMAFLVAFSLTWIVGGTVLATLFSSAGPVYYQAFGFGDTFAAQMQKLAELNEISPVWSLEVQQILLDNYRADGPVRGISAMPSMHVATSVLLALFAFSYSRVLGWAMAVFAGSILIGSVHLGWHYAVDGYFSIVIAGICWWFAKTLAKRFSDPSY